MTVTPQGGGHAASMIQALSGVPRSLAVWALTRLDPEAWARLHTGQHLRVHLGAGVGRSIWLRHVYEPDVEAHLRRVLQPGDTFIDVGANVGYFSLVAAQLVGDGGEVHAFEPGALASRLLARSTAKNGLSSIWCHRIALWSEDSDMDLAYTHDSAFRYIRRGPHPMGQAVRGVRLDEYADTVGIRRPVQLVKIDVEGAEVEVLRGMRHLITSDGPTLIIEAHDGNLGRFGHRLEDIFAELQVHGYTAMTSDGHAVSDGPSARAALASRLAPNLVFQAR